MRVDECALSSPADEKVEIDTESESLQNPPIFSALGVNIGPAALSVAVAPEAPATLKTEAPPAPVMMRGRTLSVATFLPAATVRMGGGQEETPDSRPSSPL